MIHKLTLQQRIFAITVGLIFSSWALVWLAVRPEYKKQIVQQRSTIVYQLQQYTMQEVDAVFRNWLNSTNYVAEELIRNPGETESLIRRAIGLTPRLMRVNINEAGSTSQVDIKRTLYNEVVFPEGMLSWFESRLDPRISIAWLLDEPQNVAFFVTERNIQLGNQIFVLRFYFDATSILRNLTALPIEGQNFALVFNPMGEPISNKELAKIPSSVLSSGGISQLEEHFFDGTEWFLISSRFESVPFQHVVAIEKNVILKPVNDLIRFMLYASGIILILMAGFSWYVSRRVNKPIASLLNDVEYLDALDFTHEIRTTDLPEFDVMRGTLEKIRLTLQRYQALNVEKIILEEWKNKYMMTYSQDLIAIIEESGHFSFANNQFIAFLESLQLPVKEATLDMIFNSANISYKLLSATSHKPDPFNVHITKGELTHEIMNSGTNYYHYQKMSISDAHGEERGALIFMHDTTEDRLLEQKRSDMINMIAHELKNPLTGIIGLTDLLQNVSTLSEEEITEFTQEIMVSAKRMNVLVNRFLDVQRLESGKVQIELYPVDLRELLEEIILVSKYALSSKLLKLKFERRGSDFIVRGSRDLLFDAIQNILSNAIKYGDSNREILLELYKDEETINIACTDFGYGIDFSEQHKVFDKFFRSKKNIKAAKEKGSGLGLAYVKEIMNRHEGQIYLESNSGIGTKFVLSFPCLVKDEWQPEMK